MNHCPICKVDTDLDDGYLPKVVTSRVRLLIHAACHADGRDAEDWEVVGEQVLPDATETEIDVAHLFLFRILEDDSEPM